MASYTVTVKNWTEFRVFVGGKLTETAFSESGAIYLALEAREKGETADIWIMEVGVLELPRKRFSV